MSSQTTLDNLLRSHGSPVSTHRRVLHVSGNFKLTKTPMGHTEAYFLRDEELESSVDCALAPHGGTQSILQRYSKYEDLPISLIRPNHLPVRILAGKGAITSGENVFLFFPGVLGPNTNAAVSDYYGFEFIDVWGSIFLTQIFPSGRLILSSESYSQLFLHLRTVLERTIYLASIFHETGHRVGPWKCNGTSAVAPSFASDIMGELSTDLMMIDTLKEFPEISMFVTVARLFWFTRRGFRADPVHGLLGSDHDAWIGTLLWNRLRRRQLLRMINGQWHLEWENLIPFYQELLVEVTGLAPSRCKDSDALNSWMKTQVDWNQGYNLPREFRDLMNRLSGIGTTRFVCPLSLDEARRIANGTSHLIRNREIA